MRPRVFPAEDLAAWSGSPSERCFNEAAGIPRGRRGGPDMTVDMLTTASMRPRVFPAEDAGGLIVEVA